MSNPLNISASLNALEALVMGASAGAIAALSQILPKLPQEYRLPVLIVVHQRPEKFSSVAALFQSKCRLPVKEAEDKEPIIPGTVYFAPPDYHLLVEKDKVLSLSTDEPVNYSRPAIDVLFESAAAAYGRRLIGVILTGANHDGARGLKAICTGGGVAWVQDPASAEVSAMPEAALATCPGAKSANLEELSLLVYCAGLPKQ